MRTPPAPPPDVEFEAETTGRSMLLGLVTVVGGIAAFIGVSFVGSIFIASWAGIVLPLGIAFVVVCLWLVVTATKEGGW